VLLRLLLATSLAATGLLLAPDAAACSSAAPVAVELPTLHLELAADRSSYRRGEHATLRVTVTQAVADGPPVRDAVTEVDLSVGGRRVKRVGGSTAADGRLVLRFAVPRNAPVGRVKAVATSRARLMVGAECDDLVSGTGSATVDPLMVLRS
jgi:hypothetical protein